jgi:hypothetical protein
VPFYANVLAFACAEDCSRAGFAGEFSDYFPIVKMLVAFWSKERIGKSFTLFWAVLTPLYVKYDKGSRKQC